MTLLHTLLLFYNLLFFFQDGTQLSLNVAKPLFYFARYIDRRPDSPFATARMTLYRVYGTWPEVHHACHGGNSCTKNECKPRRPDKLQAVNIGVTKQNFCPGRYPLTRGLLDLDCEVFVQDELTEKTNWLGESYLVCFFPSH